MKKKISVKFQDVIIRYDPSEDFLDWIDRFEDLAKLHQIDNLEKVLPGLLGTKAYPVYKNLDQNIKKNFNSLKKALIKAFNVDSCL